MSLVFAASSFNKLDEDTRDYLVDLYHNYYEKIYGVDAIDAFLKVTNTSINQYSIMLEDMAINYKEAINNLSGDIIIMLIYNNELDLIGCSRIKDEKNNIRVLDIVFDIKNKKEEREYWLEAVSFLECFYRAKGYNKMYLEIPLKEGPLLIRANELGFIEDPEDISINAKTYILNKLIGSNKDE